MWADLRRRRLLSSRTPDPQPRSPASPPTGPIEQFLKAVRKALVAGRGRVGNLARLDIRLALIAANTNRADAPRHYFHTLAEAPGRADLQRLPSRELDEAAFKPE